MTCHIQRVWPQTGNSQEWSVGMEGGKPAAPARIRLTHTLCCTKKKCNDRGEAYGKGFWV